MRYWCAEVIDILKKISFSFLSFFKITYSDIWIFKPNMLIRFYKFSSIKSFQLKDHLRKLYGIEKVDLYCRDPSTASVYSFEQAWWDLLRPWDIEVGWFLIEAILSPLLSSGALCIIRCVLQLLGALFFCRFTLDLIEEVNEVLLTHVILFAAFFRFIIYDNILLGLVSFGFGHWLSSFNRDFWELNLLVNLRLLALVIFVQLLSGGLDI